MPRTRQIRNKSMLKNRRTGEVSMANSTDSSRTTEQTNSDSENLDLYLRETPDTTVQALVAKEYKSPDGFLKEFDNYYQAQIQKHNQAYEKSCEEVKKMFRNILQQLPDAVKCANIHGVLEKDYPIDVNAELNSTCAQSVSKLPPSKRTMTNGMKQTRTPRAVKFGTSRKKSLPVTTRAPATQTETFKTPLVSARRLPPGTTITPKIYSESPITMMRRPLHGEVAISLGGSPLMVGATSCEDIPTVNVPLQDGRIFSIMPEEGEPPFDLPCFDETTRKYLKTLRDHLKILAPNTP